MLKSAITIRPGHPASRKHTLTSFFLLLDVSELLADKLRKPVKILLQHNLKNDVMAVSVEVGVKTFAGVEKTFEKALKSVANEILNFVEGRNEPKQAKERAAGKKSSRRSRRARSAR
jgi:hypothetical protein